MKKISKWSSQSGNSRHVSPVVISENSKTRVQLLPTYYTRKSTGTEELSLSIQIHQKSKDGDWVYNKDKSTSFKADTIEKLQTALGEFLAIVGMETETEFLVSEAKSFVISSEADLKSVFEGLSDAMSQNPKLFDTLNSNSFSNELSFALENHSRLRVMKESIATLEAMIPNDDLVEQDYQNWFEKNYWVLGNDYIARDEIRDISESDSLDLLMERTANGLRDIVELKRPLHGVLREDKSRKTFSFREQVSSAIGQCARYLEILSIRHANGMYDRPEISFHNPTATIIIGRSHDWSEKEHRALNSLNSHLHGIQVKTFDYVLLEAKATLQSFTQGVQEIPSEATDDLDIVIPF